MLIQFSVQTIQGMETPPCPPPPLPLPLPLLPLGWMSFHYKVSLESMILQLSLTVEHLGGEWHC